MPAVGISLILIAIGAVLAFAVTASVQGIALPTMGVILMVVGGFGLLISLVYLMTATSAEIEHDIHHEV